MENGTTTAFPSQQPSPATATQQHQAAAAAAAAHQLAAFQAAAASGTPKDLLLIRNLSEGRK